MDAQEIVPTSLPLDWHVAEIRADGSIVLGSAEDVAPTLQKLQGLARDSVYVILRTSISTSHFVRVHRFDEAQHPELTLRIEDPRVIIDMGIHAPTGQQTLPSQAFRVAVGDLFVLADGKFLRGESS